MLSKDDSNSAFFAVFHGKTPPNNSICKLIREHCTEKRLQADVFTYGRKTLVIAYPEPPGALRRTSPSVRLRR